MKKIFTLVSFISLFLISTLSQVSLSNWMSAISDNTPVSALLLPGTHDAGSYAKGGSYVLTQDISIKEQMAIGVRAFDIRLVAENNQLIIYHGSFSQDINFVTQTLPDMLNFLDQHPSETLIITFRKEGDDKNSNISYVNLLRQALTAERFKNRILNLFKANFSMREARGKIIVISRDNLGSPQIGGKFSGWADNTTFSREIQSSYSIYNAQAHIQDAYSIGTLSQVDAKKNVVSDLLNQSALNFNTSHWFINYLNGAGIFATPVAIADRMLPHADVHISKMKTAPRGIVFMDFAGSEKGKSLINTIINTNKRFYLNAYPTVSQTLLITSNEENEYWYYIMFKNGLAVLQDMGENQKILTQKPEIDKNEQLWKLSLDRNGDYILTNKSGRKLYFENKKFISSSSRNISFMLTKSTNTSFVNSYELERIGADGLRMNQFEGAGINREIGEWTAADNGNPLVFILASTSNNFPYSNERRNIWFTMRSVNNKYIYANTDHSLHYKEGITMISDAFLFSFHLENGNVKWYNKLSGKLPIATKENRILAEGNSDGDNWKLISKIDFPAFTHIQSLKNKQYINPVYGLSEGEMGFYEQVVEDFGNQWILEFYRFENIDFTSTKNIRENNELEISILDRKIIVPNIKMDHFSLFNLQGQIVNIHNQLTPGIYIIRSKKNQKTAKIIVR